MATVGIVDADLLAGREYRHPNLAAMKLSAYHKRQGNVVSLVPSYQHVTSFDRVFICCVFTDTAGTVPPAILRLPNVQHGGTGFFFDRAPPLPPTIEHSRPDYSLYSLWPRCKDNPYYTDCSIGFLTRGCFRRCKFCVNHNRRRCRKASPLREFYDRQKSKVCLLDDNVLAYKGHRELIEELVHTCERDKNLWEFKQGIDIRLLTPPVANLFDSPSHFGEVIFAFDSIKDTPSVLRGLKVLRKHLPSKGAKAYILCGFEQQGQRDIATVFRRLQILWEYRCLGYLMRYKDCRLAPPVCWRLYTYLAAWINQPGFQRVKSFRAYCEVVGGGALRALRAFEKEHPDTARRCFDLRYHTASSL